MIIDDRDEPTVYRRIAADLRARIAHGDLRGRRQLPSEKDLQSQYSAARDTVRAAVRLLSGLGLVFTLKGKGTFIRLREQIVLDLEPGMRILSRPASVIEREEMELDAAAWVTVVERAAGEPEVWPAARVEFRVAP